LPPHLLEKDIWVVWSLHQLFTGPYADHLVFKGRIGADVLRNDRDTMQRFLGVK